MIEAIVVDMDGTFLDDRKHYNKERFIKLYKQLAKLNIKFVVASGNQYQHLASFFPEIRNQITFIAENGAKIIDQGEVIYSNPIPEKYTSKVLKLVDKCSIFEGYRLVISGENAAYIKKNSPVRHRKKADFFYQNLVEVCSYETITDMIYKFAFNFHPKVVEECENILNTYFLGNLKAMTSGFEAIDLVYKNSGKEIGIEILAKRWAIPLNNIAAFGDNLNDLAMLKKVGHAYAVENSRKEVKQIAHKIIGTNNQAAVLDEIELIIKMNMIKKNIIEYL